MSTFSPHCGYGKIESQWLNVFARTLSKLESSVNVIHLRSTVIFEISTLNLGKLQCGYILFPFIGYGKLLLNKEILIYKDFPRQKKQFQLSAFRKCFLRSSWVEIKTPTFTGSHHLLVDVRLQQVFCWHAVKVNLDF